MEVPGRFRKCDVCIQDGKHIISKKYCPECSQHLCAACSNAHKRIQATKQHELVDDVLEGDRNAPEHRPYIQNDLCETHSIPINYFCETHDMLHCGDCLLDDRSVCKMVKITEKSRDYKSSEDYKKIQAGLTSLTQTTHQSKIDIQHMTELLKGTERESKNQLQKYKAMIVEDLNQRVKDLDMQITSKTSCSLSTLSELKKACDTSDADVKHIQDIHKQVEKDNRLLFIVSHRSRKKVDELSDSLEKVAVARVNVPIFEFTENNDATTALANSSWIGDFSENGAATQLTHQSKIKA